MKRSTKKMLTWIGLAAVALVAGWYILFLKKKRKEAEEAAAKAKGQIPPPPSTFDDMDPKATAAS